MDLSVAREFACREFCTAMRVIDSHVHLYPPELNRDPLEWATSRGEAQWSGLCLRRRKNRTAVQGFPSVDELLQEMDHARVERAVLLGWYWTNGDTCELHNRFYAQCVRDHPDRLSAFATLQPLAGRDKTIAELRRAHGDGLVGLGELSPHSQGYGVTDEVFREVLALAAEWKLPVNLHVTDPNSREYPGRVETPLEDFVSIATAFPQVNFILAHWGGLLPLRDAATAELRNVFYDTAASPLMYDNTVWERVLASVDREHVLFGSDFPLNLYPKLAEKPEMRHFITEAITAQVPLEVMSENAEKLIRF
jgi:predicted TIM-barrel fold metal-dependent hydrolase